MARRRAVIVFLTVLIGSVVASTAPAAASSPTIVEYSSFRYGDAVGLHWRTTGAAIGGVYIYGPRITGGSVRDVGFRGSDGDIVFFAPWGQDHYLLNVSNGSQTVAQEVVVDVQRPAPVSVTSTNPQYLDVFNIPTSTTIMWNRTSGSYAVVLAPDGTVVYKGTGSSYGVPQSAITPAASPPPSRSLFRYRIQACNGAQSDYGQATTLCSELMQANLVVTGSRFFGPFRQFTPPGSSYTLFWNIPTSPGYSWHLDAPTLDVSEGLTTNMRTFTNLAACTTLT